MNYRHAYHVGNFADVVKHIILTRVLDYMKRKDAPFYMLDTHAGCGVYSLLSEQAGKTLEWQNGIAPFMEAIGDAPKPIQQLCAPFRALVGKLNPEGALSVYPGSPEVASELLRRDDRLSLNELHPADFATLEARYGRQRGVLLGNLDGYTALKAQMPPKERRGVVLIDPPYEVRNEFDTIIVAAIAAMKRFSTGTYMVWYPVKHGPLVQSFRHVMTNNIKAEMLDIVIQRETFRGTELFAGTGMLIINPPYVLAEEMKLLAPWLTKLFETRNGSGRWHVETL